MPDFTNDCVKVRINAFTKQKTLLTIDLLNMRHNNLD